MFAILRHHSLFHQLFLSIIFVALLGLTLNWFFMFRHGVMTSCEYLTQGNTRLAVNIAESISHDVRNLVHHMEQTAALLRYVELSSPIVHEILRSTIDRSLLEELILLDAEFNVIAAVPSDKALTFPTELLGQVFRTGQPLSTEVLFKDGTGSLSLIVPIMGEGQGIGALVASNICCSILSWPVAITDTDVFLLDAKANVISHSEPSFVGINLTGIDMTRTDSKTPLSITDIMAQPETQVVRYMWQGKARETVLTPIPGTTWWLGLAQYHVDATRLLRVLRNRSLLIAALSIGVSCLMALVIARSITRLVSQLSTYATRIANGEFPTRMSIKSPLLEFQALKGSLEQMSFQLQDSYLETIAALVTALEQKDRYTQGHSLRVSNLAVLIGQEMNLPEEELNKLRLAAVLHDVGKIAIPEAILNKPEALTRTEYEIVKLHPQKSAEIIKGISVLQPIIPIVKHHHERPDGCGYPSGLTLRDIPLLTQILAVADAWDAMTSDRPYRKAMSVEQALQVMKENRGTQFSAQVVNALLNILEERPALIRAQIAPAT
ncbi:MAG: HD domain-containing protein [Firmicutes bacterium]|nr:HD domain-containing protein [Bacillota bacterium]